MIDQIFDACVIFLIFLAELFGTTYKAINVWIFVFIWPAFTLLLMTLIILQQLKIRGLLRQEHNSKSRTTLKNNSTHHQTEG